MDQENEEKTVLIDVRVKPDARSGRPAMPCIVHSFGTAAGVTHWLSTNKEFLIGRSPEADVCIPDRLVSQRHARMIVCPEGAVFIEDLGSTNGTYVNDEKVMRRALRDGDEVLLLPDYRLKFCYQVNAITEAAEKSEAEATQDAKTGNVATLDTRACNYTRKEILIQIDQDFIQAKKQNEDLALLMVAIDGFAKINQIHGQEAAAMVLREVTKVVNSVLRREDVLARYNNDTFVILLHKMNEAAVVVLSQRIRRSVKYHHFIHAGERIGVTVSLGIGCLTRKMKSAMNLIQQVQAYLDKAKSVGPDTVNGSQSICTIFHQIGNKRVA
ncbi:MAG: GGDEF domain-containing protein [Gammaproteobacteria bacterium]|nr:GGDEF domain-containing protein [Gammaproteobacteria bacterium]MDH3406968.1 GGDEF domain-containing protein [Gammaproteobacteria bacterium]MDH3563289.1 GGDEF domain-containing protein [Gammaproteobacteria bacterium]